MSNSISCITSLKGKTSNLFWTFLRKQRNFTCKLYNNFGLKALAILLCENAVNRFLLQTSYPTLMKKDTWHFFVFIDNNKSCKSFFFSLRNNFLQIYTLPNTDLGIWDDVLKFLHKLYCFLETTVKQIHLINERLR